MSDSMLSHNDFDVDVENINRDNGEFDGSRTLPMLSEKDNNIKGKGYDNLSNRESEYEIESSNSSKVIRSSSNLSKASSKYDRLLEI